MGEQHEFDNAVRAKILSHALPHIQNYNGKVVVVKYGGNAMTEPGLQESVMKDIALLTLVGVKVVLVHGGGPELDKELAAIGKKTVKVDGLRVTDEETASIAQMVLAGRVNKDLVRMLQNVGAKAIGLCGLDGGMIKTKQLDPKLGVVGEIEDIDIKPIETVFNAGYVPVISTVGADDEGNVYNINADSAAAAIAGWLKAECLILMTNTPGVLADVDDEDSLYSVLTSADLENMIEDGSLEGGMIPKAICTIRSLEMGVKRVFIIDGRVKQALLIELLTDEGLGTQVTIK